MGIRKIDRKIKELQSLKSWLEYKLQLVDLKIVCGVYSSDDFINNSNESDEEISKKISAYNMLRVNLPQDNNRITDNIRYNAYRWYDVFHRCYFSILDEYRTDIKEKGKNIFNKNKKLLKSNGHNKNINDNQIDDVDESVQEQSGTFKDVISCLFGQIDKKINNSINKASKVEVKKGSYFQNLKNAWKCYRNSNKINSQQDNNSKMEVNFSIVSFANYTSRLMKQFDLETYNLCYSIYQEIINNGIYENVALSIRQNFEEIKKMVDSANKLVEMFNELDVKNIDECLYKECVDLYKRLLGKYGKDILLILPCEFERLLNDYGTKLKIQKANTIDNKILNSIKKVMDKILFFQLEQTDESLMKCEKILNDSLEYINNLTKSEYEDIVFNNQVLLNKFNRLKEVRHNLYGEFVVTKFTKLINDSFDFKDSEEIKYDESQMVYCIKFYNRMSEEDKKAISKETMQIYNDALRFNSILTLKTMLSELDILKCINNNQYNDIYYCCGIYDRFHSKLRCGKSKGGNDMAKRRRLGREEIENFPVEIKEKLTNVLNLRSEIITQKGDFKVSYFDAIVNKKNRHFAYVSVLVDNFEVEKITIPLTGNDNNLDEVFLAIIKKYPNVDIERIKSNELGVAYKKVL